MAVDYKLIGARIKAERNRCGLTQEALAEKLDVSIGYVSQVERGITKISLDLLGNLSAILHCPLELFINDSAPKASEYLNGVMESRFSQLTETERRVVYDLMESLIKNRNNGQR